MMTALLARSDELIKQFASCLHQVVKLPCDAALPVCPLHINHPTSARKADATERQHASWKSIRELDHIRGGH